MTATERLPFSAITSELLVPATRFRWKKCRTGYVFSKPMKFVISLTNVTDQRPSIPAMAPEADDLRSRFKAEEEERR
jgi:hypothetical protein